MLETVSHSFYGTSCDHGWRPYCEFRTSI